MSEPEALVAKDLRPEGEVLTNSRWGNTDLPDSELPKLDPVLENSIAQLFFNRASIQADRLYSKTKVLETEGWDEVTWGEAAAQVARLAYVLQHKFDIGKGDKVAIFSFTRHEWTIADLAILSLGAVSIPIYHSLAASEAAYILHNSGADVVFAENQEQVDKLRDIDSKPMPMPASEISEAEDVQLKLRSIISFEEAKSERLAPRLFNFKELISANSKHCPDDNEGLIKSLRERLKSCSRDQLASFVYTSGTTGAPKGVVQTHGNHLAMLEGLLYSGLMVGGSGIFLFLPLAHSFARLIFYGVLVSGGDMIFTAVVNKNSSEFSAKQMFDDIRESEPIVFPAVPRMFEKVMTGVLGKAEAAGFIKGALVKWSLKNYKPLLEKGYDSLGVIEKLKYTLASSIVLKIRYSIFGTKLKFCISGGAPLDISVAEFFNSLGVLILEGYGLTETTPAISANTETKNKFGSVGRVFSGVEIKLAPDGELACRGENVAQGYYKMPIATAEAWKDGWFYSGDIAEIDEAGYIRITDRKKDIIVNAGGKNIAPKKIEGKLKNIAYISQAVVYGDKKPYMVGLMTLDEENMSNWAKANIKDWNGDLEYLANHAKVKALIDAELEKINVDLASYEEVKRYRLLAEDFTIENGLLSPTLKLKRRVAYKQFGKLIESIYEA